MLLHFLFQKRKIQSMSLWRNYTNRREFWPCGGEIRLPHMGNVLITFRHNISLLRLLWCRLVCQDSN